MSTRQLIEEKCDRCGATKCSETDVDVRACFVMEVPIYRDKYVDLCSSCMEEAKARAEAFMEEKTRNGNQEQTR